MLERLAKDNAEKLRIVKVDVADNREWAAEQKVRGIPTFQIYADGKKLEQFAGGYPESFLQKKIDKYSASLASAGGAGSGDSKSEDAAIKPMPKDWLPPGVTRK